jgi:hypothetical protein
MTNPSSNLPEGSADAPNNEVLNQVRRRGSMLSGRTRRITRRTSNTDVQTAELDASGREGRGSGIAHTAAVQVLHPADWQGERLEREGKEPDQ